MENIEPSSEDIKETMEAFKVLNESLGDDSIHKEIILEEIFKILLKKGR
jgi:hypothetical protein